MNDRSHKLPMKEDESSCQMEELHSVSSSSRAEQDIAGTFGASHGALYAADDQKMLILVRKLV